jgi:ABC-2 type transport system permease protein
VASKITPQPVVNTMQKHILRRLSVYWQVWKFTAFNALQQAFINRGSNVLFLFGKVIRLSMSLLFLWLIRENVHVFAGYTTDQMIVFFLTYQVVDIVSQVFFRGVYMFGEQVRTGEFDFLLAKPISPLFRSLTGLPDINDTIFLIPTLGVMTWILTQLDITITLSSLLWYGLLLINSFLIATALHILVLVMGILTTEVDGIIWLYRDLIRMGEFPITIYPELLRFALFFIIPVGFMVTIPAEVLLNTQPAYSALASLGFGVTFLWISLRVWTWSLKRYSSASS